MWLYIIIAVVVVGGLGFLFLSKKKMGATEDIAEGEGTLEESAVEESIDMPEESQEESQLETSAEDEMSGISGENPDEEIKI